MGKFCVSTGSNDSEDLLANESLRFVKLLLAKCIAMAMPIAIKGKLTAKGQIRVRTNDLMSSKRSDWNFSAVRLPFNKLTSKISNSRLASYQTINPDASHKTMFPPMIQNNKRERRE